MFKSQLQEYAQKAGLAAPIYDVTKEGPSHEPQFKASVTIHGKTEIGQLHESGLCKNLLQEYAQKCKLPLPVYNVVKTGEVHSPMFSATVEIAGVHYNGGKCKTKKEAEIKAAKTALVAIYADSGPSRLDAAEDQAADAVEDQAVDEKPTPEPKSGNKRKKLFKVGSDSRKQKVKVEQTPDAEAVNNSGDNSEQANGSPAKASGDLTSQVPKQEVCEQELVGSPADSCTAAAIKATSCNNSSAQEQRA
ncbi:hypothetical protein GOP47_0013525 [Adiantum capillus-veneris]|uniref:DRBM domain-containing protein n=1 Tax=Adiantum capillus-veneris TaxID=13818 RepID=A0A9D4ZDH0_ADICA|nr:hypothetical protein GOP47_0013525 [Adiantum capillus-veneris]